MGGYERIAHETLDLAVLGELGLELLDPRGQLRALLTKGILARPEAREQPIDGLGLQRGARQHCSKLVQRRRRAAHVFTRVSRRRWSRPDCQEKPLIREIPPSPHPR